PVLLNETQESGVEVEGSKPSVGRWKKSWGKSHAHPPIEGWALGPLSPQRRAPQCPAPVSESQTTDSIDDGGRIRWRPPHPVARGLTPRFGVCRPRDLDFIRERSRGLTPWVSLCCPVGGGAGGSGKSTGLHKPDCSFS